MFILMLLFLRSNAIEHPSEEKYRKLRTENKAFNTKLWSLPEARQFLMVWGWIEVGYDILPNNPA